MNALIFFNFLFLTAAAQSSFDYEEEWKAFKIKYFRHYNSPEEENYRKEIFFKRLEEIEIHNMKYELGLTPYENHIDNYSDYSHAEILNLQEFLKELQHQMQYGNGNRPHFKISLFILISSLGFIISKFVTYI